MLTIIFMPLIITFFLILASTVAFSQDSVKYKKLIGTNAPDITLYDTAGKKVKLSSFKGKVIYLDIWESTCGICIKLFPSEEKLAHRLKINNLDTSIVIVKICSDCPEDEWKELISKYNSTSINLLLKGKKYRLSRKLEFVPFPTYYIIGKDFTFLGADVFMPNNELIDYLLFRATANIIATDAIREATTFSQLENPPIWYVEWKNRNDNLKK